jgi:hypothetical protein
MTAMHRETLRRVLSLLQTCEDLGQARTQIARLLGSFDKLQRQGLDADDALDLAADRIAQCPPPPPRRDTTPIAAMVVAAAEAKLKHSGPDAVPIRRLLKGRVAP